MSMAGTFAKGVGSLFKGLLLGILAIILVVAGFIVLSSIASAESPDVFEHPSADVVALTAALGDLEIVVIEAAVEIAASDCRKANEWLEYALGYIERSIERQPKTAYIYADTIKALEESRCEE